MQQIILRTPLWVWPLLAFLVYRGLLASVDRETSLKKAFVIPAVMLTINAGFRQEIAFVITVGALYGLFNGIFIGKLRHTVAMYRASADFMPPSPEPALVKQSNML